MEYSGGMMPYPPPTGGGKASHHPLPGFPHKTRGQKNNAYRNSRKHQRDPSHGETTDLCYNCGSLEHWSQNCPQLQRRETYPGPAPHPNPAKRAKHHRYSTGQLRGGHPPHSQVPYEYDYDYEYDYPPPHGPDPRYERMPMDPGYGEPPMHHARPPPPHERWQQGPPPHRERYPYPPSYPPPDARPPMPGYGPPPPGPHRPPPKGYYPREYPPVEEPDYYRYPAEPRPYPPPDRRRPGPAPGPGPGPGPKMWKHPEAPYRRPPPPETWTDEPGPPEAAEGRAQDGQIVWKPPVQVARPLPSTFDPREEAHSLPHVASLPRGMSVSKYILDKPVDDFLCNIKETEDWPFMMADPIFLTIAGETEMISVQQLIERRIKLFETHRVQPRTQTSSDVDRDDTKSEAEHFEDQKSDDGYSDYVRDPQSPRNPSRESSISPVDYEEPGQNQHQPAANENGSPPEGPRELGQQNQGDEEENHHNGFAHGDDGLNGFPNQTRSQHSGTHTETQHQEYQGQRPYNTEQFSNKRQRPDDRRFNQPNNFGPQSNHRTKPHPSNGQGPKHKKYMGPKRGAYEHGENGVTEPSTSADSGNGIHATSGLADYEGPKAQGQPTRDNRRWSKHEESPGSPADEPRRQEDDVTPKLKRRHPKVAEAYSRRW